VQIGLIDWSALGALASVILIDLTLAGDNAIMVGLAAAGLPAEQRSRAVWIGIAVATVLRVALAAVAVQLLALLGLTLAGGLLLLWVVWRLYRDWRAGELAKSGGGEARAVSMATAVSRLVIADISMSLDNVLAVAGAARDHFWVLVAGLLLSVAMMGLASQLLLKLLARYRWVAVVGMLVIAVVALRMIYDGSYEVWSRLVE